MGRFAGDPDAANKAASILFDLTRDQLELWGAKYHDLILGKPVYDLFIDDKCINTTAWEEIGRCIPNLS